MSLEYPEPPAVFEDGAGRQVRLRPMQDPDRWNEDLVALYTRFDTEDRAQGIPPTGEDAIADWLDGILPGSVAVLATHGDRVVGHAMLVPDIEDPSRLDHPGSVRWELAIFVERDYQRTGIGRALLEHLLGHAVSRGVEQVWLTVERWNGPAIRLYRSVGFEDRGAERFEMEMDLDLTGQTESTG